MNHPSSDSSNRCASSVYLPLNPPPLALVLKMFTRALTPTTAGMCPVRLRPPRSRFVVKRPPRMHAEDRESCLLARAASVSDATWKLFLFLSAAARRPYKVPSIHRLQLQRQEGSALQNSVALPPWFCLECGRDLGEAARLPWCCLRMAEVAADATSAR